MAAIDDINVLRRRMQRMNPAQREKFIGTLPNTANIRNILAQLKPELEQFDIDKQKAEREAAKTEAEAKLQAELDKPTPVVSATSSTPSVVPSIVGTKKVGPPPEFRGTDLLRTITKPIRATTERRKRQFRQAAAKRGLTPFEARAAEETSKRIGKQGAEAEATAATQVGLKGAELGRAERLTDEERQFIREERIGTQDFNKIMQASRISAVASEAAKDRAFNKYIADEKIRMGRDLSADELTEKRREFDRELEIKKRKIALEEAKFKESQKGGGFLDILGGIAGFLPGVGSIISAINSIPKNKNKKETFMA